MEALVPLGKMKPAGMHVFNNRSDAKGYTAEDRNIPLSDAFEAQINANHQRGISLPIWHHLIGGILSGGP